MRADDLELADVVVDIEVDQAIVLFLIRRPGVPAKAVIHCEPRGHFKGVVDIQPKLLLLEVEIAAVVLI